MLQIKIVSYRSAVEVEDEINNWMNRTGYTINKISYSTAVVKGELRHSVLISYSR